MIVNRPLTHKYVFSLAVPITLIVAVDCSNHLLWPLVITTPGVEASMNAFIFLIPSMAFWLLLKREYEPRVLLWTSFVASIFNFDMVPICAALLCFFALHKNLRIAGLVIFGLCAALGWLLFLFSHTWKGYEIYGEGKFHKPLEVKNTGLFEASIHMQSGGALDPDIYNVEVEKKICSFLSRRKHIFMKQFGYIEHLKVVDSHTIQFDVITNRNYDSTSPEFTRKRFRID